MINHLDIDDFRKREALYELYDVYKDHQLPHSKEKLSECKTLGHLTRIHNEIIKYYEDEENNKIIDKDLYKKRMEMKDLINKFRLKLNDSCLYFKTFEIRTSKYEEQELEKKLAAERQQKLEEKLAAERQQKLEEKLVAERQQASLLSLDTIDLDPGQDEDYPITKVTQDRQRHHTVTNHPVVTGHSRSPQGRGPLDNSLVDEQADNFYTTRSPFNSQLNAENPISEEGIIGSMRSTLSNIVQSVDPVPVVGVSEEEGDAYIEFPAVSMDNS
ncbi:hypothetical protein PVBG_05704 [Plasmodium vivax Brazil I]|uniref:Uncharacterized protein n=1 Tax=Plasmodium vivax (strain Brazil I) TaxID=1033975 RepID=A0A0J9T2H3_PLAV1|nr:hypothetical protein PVBG_05704 [Plasmodium vivax Brazil I]